MARPPTANVLPNGASRRRRAASATDAGQIPPRDTPSTSWKPACAAPADRTTFRSHATDPGWISYPFYYVLLGQEEGVTQRGGNDLYLIGDDWKYQANVAEFIPGEAGYTPHWNVNLVNTAPGKTLADILASPYASAHYPEALFDDAEDILGAQDAGLVTIFKPGVVVLCPIISEEGAEAPGNTELPEELPPFPDTF